MTNPMRCVKCGKIYSCLTKSEIKYCKDCPMFGVCFFHKVEIDDKRIITSVCNDCFVR